MNAAADFDAGHYRAGSDTFYRHPLGLLFTQGINDMAEAYGAFWLLDVVGSAQLCGGSAEPFQVWQIRCVSGTEFVVQAFTDTPGRLIYRQEIPFSDFPIEEFEFYCADGVILLKEEY